MYVSNLYTDFFCNTFFTKTKESYERPIRELRNETSSCQVILSNVRFIQSMDTRVVSYLPNIFKCLETDVLSGEAFFREKSSCLFHLL